MRRTSVSALLLAAALLGWWACSSDESADGGQDGGNDAGGSAGNGGAGATGGALTGGGTGGTGGAADAGWGADPKWEATTAVAAGCPIERLTNASELRVFTWEPCSWSPDDCEQAVFNPTLVGTGGTVVRIGLAFLLTKNISLFATEAGTGLDGIRTTGSIDNCLLASASVWGSRFGVVLGAPSAKSFGGVVGELGTSTGLEAFTLTNPPLGVSQWYLLGTDRWVWWWAPAYSYTSVSAIDGSGYVQFANTTSPSSLVYLGQPVTTGKTFLFQAFEGDDAGIAHGKIMWSDGLAAPQVYLEPADPDDAYGSPIYANTHVAYFRGIQIQDTNKFQSVELWASPYSDNPSELQPVKLDTLAITSIPPSRAGGWGFAAFPSFAPPNGERELVMWDLAEGTKRTHVLPESYDLQSVLGVSRTHFWVGAGKLGAAPALYLIRIRLE